MTRQLSSRRRPARAGAGAAPQLPRPRLRPPAPGAQEHFSRWDHGLSRNWRRLRPTLGGQWPPHPPTAQRNTKNTHRWLCSFLTLTTKVLLHAPQERTEPRLVRCQHLWKQVSPGTVRVEREPGPRCPHLHTGREEDGALGLPAGRAGGVEVGLGWMEGEGVSGRSP